MCLFLPDDMLDVDDQSENPLFFYLRRRKLTDLGKPTSNSNAPLTYIVGCSRQKTGKKKSMLS